MKASSRISADIRRLKLQADFAQHGQRRCSKCKRVKRIELFARNRRHKGGIGYECKCCIRQRLAAAYATVPDTYRARHRAWTKQNLPAIAEYQREYRKQNWEHIRERERAYAAAHREQCREAVRRSRRKKKCAQLM